MHFSRAEIETAWRRCMAPQDACAGHGMFSFQEDRYNRHETDTVLTEWSAAQRK